LVLSIFLLLKYTKNSLTGWLFFPKYCRLSRICRYLTYYG